MGLCAPLRAPEWIWGCLGGHGQGPVARSSPQRHLSLHQTLPVSLTSLSVSLCVCVCLCLCVCCMHPYQVCACPVCMFVNTPTSGCAMPLYTHPGLFVFLSRVPGSMSKYVSLCVQVCLSTREFVHTWSCA